MGCVKIKTALTVVFILESCFILCNCEIVSKKSRFIRNLGEENMKINFETGRSMVEMLGTLAIIGVLSIAGIAGYSYAMDKHRANTIVNEVNLRAMDLIAQANRSGELSLSNWPTKIAGDYDIGLEIDATTNITEGGIFVSGVKQRVCDIIVDSLPEDIDFTVNNTASSTS